MMSEQKILYMWIYVYVKFSKRKYQQWRMVLCEWCKLWDHSAFVLKTSSGARFGGGGALPYLAYTSQVYAAEHKVLSIKQGVEFYYFNSKTLIIYFIILMVKFYDNSKFA